MIAISPVALVSDWVLLDCIPIRNPRLFEHRLLPLPNRLCYNNNFGGSCTNGSCNVVPSSQQARDFRLGLTSLTRSHLPNVVGDVIRTNITGSFPTLVVV